FNRFLGNASTHLLDFLEKLDIYKRTFFQRSSHTLLRFFLSFSPLHDERIARLVPASRLESFRELSPGTYRIMPPTTPFPFTLTGSHRVVDWIHRHTADMRAPAKPTTSPGLSAGHIHVIHIAYLANRRVCILVNAPNLTGRKPHERVPCLAVI